MAMLPLKLPTIQNWSCHNCSGCCREHLIEVTDEEHQRILGQKWTAKDGIPDGQPVVVAHAGPPWKRRHRLAHREDGSCVFLNEDGLCRIHAKFGEPAKPLACRVYPYAFHPSGSRIAVSLRFSCPSVVANKGKALSQNRDELKEIQRLVVPDGTEKIDPPRITRREALDWPDTLRIVGALHDLIDGGEGTFIERLMRCLFVVGLIEQSSFKLIQGERLSEFLQIVSEAAADEPVAEPEKPVGVALMQFRLLVAHYARKDTVADLSSGLAGRWRLLRAATKFASGAGTAMPLQDCFQEVPFEAIEKPFGGLPAEADEILTRYLRVKLQGLHFCGPACYDLMVVEGFLTLALIFPAICWIARWLAASDNRDTLSVDDINRAISIADHHHGYSPVFGSGGFRRRVKMLNSTGDLQRLVLWYAQ